MDEVNNNTMRDIINILIERAEEAKENQSSEFEQGRLLGLNEALSLIKNETLDVPYIAALLDFDIDKRF